MHRTRYRLAHYARNYWRKHCKRDTITAYQEQHIQQEVCDVVVGVHESHIQRIVLVCAFSSHSFWTSSSLDVRAGVTQEEGHTGFLIHLPSAARALLFLARRIQPFLSLVDREVEFLCTNDLIVLHLLGIFFFFFQKNRKIPFTGIDLTSQRVRRLRDYVQLKKLR